jgi:predicted  nucleic acid-binding Zn-ribbon protein
MTLVDALVRLAAAVAALQQQITELNMAQGMTPEQAAQLAQAVADVAALRTAVDNLAASVTGVQTQVSDVVSQAQAQAQATASLRADLEAVRSDVAVLKQGVGDLGSLPALPQV